MAARQRRLQNACIKNVGRMLLQHAETLGDLAPRQSANGLTIEANMTLLSGRKAGQAAHQRGFADAVGAHQAPELAGADFEIQSLHDQMARDIHFQSLAAEHGHDP